MQTLKELAKNRIKVGDIVKIDNIYSLVESIDTKNEKIETNRFSDVGYAEIKETITEEELNIYSEDGYIGICLGEKKLMLQMPNSPESVHYIVDENGLWIETYELSEELQSLVCNAIAIVEKIFGTNLQLTYYSIFGEKYVYDYEYLGINYDFYIVGTDEDNYTIYKKNPLSNYYHVATYDDVDIDDMPDDIFKKLIDGYKEQISHL